MRVVVKLHALLRDYRPAGSTGSTLQLDVSDGATVQSVLDLLGIPRSRVHLAVVNDRQVTSDAALREGDVLRLFPPVAGG
jgi:molybdopterin converting factor small subunit